MEIWVFLQCQKKTGKCVSACVTVCVEVGDGGVFEVLNYIFRWKSSYSICGLYILVVFIV